MTTKQELVQAVKDYAQKNYNRGGWDVVVEAYTDVEILEVIGHCSTVTAAIKEMRAVVKAHKSYGDEIRSEAF